MRRWTQITGGLVLAGLAFILLSPLLNVHVHDNGTVHSHDSTTTHNHSDKSIPQNEIPSLLPKVVFAKGLPLEIAHSLLLLTFALIAFSFRGIAQPYVFRSILVGCIRDGTLNLPSPPRRIVGQRAPPITPSIA